MNGDQPSRTRRRRAVRRRPVVVGACVVAAALAVGVGGRAVIGGGGDPVAPEPVPVVTAGTPTVWETAPAVAVGDAPAVVAPWGDTAGVVPRGYDTDGDGAVTPREQANGLVETLTGALSTGASPLTVFAAPAVGSWWTLAVGIAEMQTVGLTAPRGATWVGVVETRTPQAPQRPTAVVMPVLHVGFASAQAAQAWATPLAALAVSVEVRDHVVSLTDAGHDLSNAGLEPLPDDLAPGVAMPYGVWQVAWGDRLAATAAETPNPEAYTAFFAGHGITSGTGTWQATAATPGGPWAGTLPGAAVDAIDPYTAARAVSATLEQCDTNPAPDCEQTMGVSGIIDAWKGMDSEGRGGGFLNVDLPTGAPLAFALAARFRGSANGTFATNSGPLVAVTYTLDRGADGTPVLTARPVLPGA